MDSKRYCSLNVTDFSILHAVFFQNYRPGIGHFSLETYKELWMRFIRLVKQMKVFQNARYFSVFCDFICIVSV